MTASHSSANVHDDTSPLRQDLKAMPTPDGRGLIIIDDIAGRFAKTTRRVWASLQPSDSITHPTQADPTVWPLAVSAGWTRRRGQVSTSSRSRWLQSPLSVRIPIASMDPIARRLVPASALVFSPWAILFWCIAGLASLCVLMIRWQQWSGSIPSLQTYLANLQPITIALTFVLTKAAHELGHAVLCRRLGSRCGVFGVWWLCFMPCPYVDVTDVWRQPTAARRAAVMAGGMMAEWILAVLAIWVWFLADSHDTRMTAMNVVLVCGVSTVLFNANPLMRYDGYFILSDFLETANLREEARRGMQRFLIAPVSHWRRFGKRVWSMSVYHLSSMAYRISLSIAIAGLVLRWAGGWGLWRVAMVIVTLAAARAIVGGGKSWWSILRGNGFWAGVDRHRRWTLATGSLIAVATLVWMPLPRYRRVEGVVRVRHATPVYLPRGGVLESVFIRVGDRVDAGVLLAEVSDPNLQLDLIRTNGQQAVLRQRVRGARLASLRSASKSNWSNSNDSIRSADNWNTLEAATESLSSRRLELEQRVDQLHIKSPVSGIVLPPDESRKNAFTTDSNRPRHASVVTSNAFVLSPGVGGSTDDRHAWCRIATDPGLEAVLVIDADDRQRIPDGSSVRLSMPSHPGRVVRTKIRDISPTQSTDAPATEHVYEAVCDLPMDADEMVNLLRWDLAACQAVLRLPSRSLWSDGVASLRRLMGQ